MVEVVKGEMTNVVAVVTSDGITEMTDVVAVVKGETTEMTDVVAVVKGETTDVVAVVKGETTDVVAVVVNGGHLVLPNQTPRVGLLLVGTADPITTAPKRSSTLSLL